MAACLQRGTTPANCVTYTEMPADNAATILKPFAPNPHSNPFTHGATCADWVAPFPSSQHSPPPPLKFFHTPLHLPPLLPFLTCTRVFKIEECLPVNLTKIVQ